MIELADLSVRLGQLRLGQRLALDRVGLACRRGEMIAVLGPNGAGKTTLLRAIAGLVEAEGRVTLGGRPLAAMTPQERARTVAYLPQGNVAHWPISARDAVSIGRMPHGGGAGRSSRADHAAIDKALAAADAAHLAERSVTELSSGERARVMLARALAVEAPVLLADEPIAALDPAHQLDVLELLAKAAAAGTTVLVVLHDLMLAARFAARVIVIDRGRIAADGPPSAVLDDALLSRVFGIEAARVDHGATPLLVPWSRHADVRK